METGLLEEDWRSPALGWAAVLSFGERLLAAAVPARAPLCQQSIGAERTTRRRSSNGREIDAPIRPLKSKRRDGLHPVACEPIAPESWF